MDLDQVISRSLNREQRNIYGDLGPRCRWCSGLGQVLALGGGNAPVTRSTSRCTCHGSGLDLETIQRNEISSLVDRMARLEQRHARDLRTQQRLLKELTTYRANGKMSRQFWSECIAWFTASGTSINTSTSETIVFPNVTVPANYMADGRLLRLQVNGSHSTLGSGTVTVIFRVRWGGVGGTLLTATGTIVQVISLTAAFWRLEVVLQTQSNGATGTILANGGAEVFGATAPTIGSATGAPAVSPMTAGGQITPAAVTVDLTADTALSITAQMGASSASNIILGRQYNLESLN